VARRALTTAAVNRDASALRRMAKRQETEDEDEEEGQEEEDGEIDDEE
jgi:hypothetical protein